MIPDWIRQSNLIEEVNDPQEDARSQNAWTWFLKQKELHTLAILEVHRRLMQKYLRKDAGHFRTRLVMVGGRLCPAASDVPTLHESWVSWWGKAKTEEQIKCAHIEWEGIHPFVDGNGRTGRMIMNWQRVHAGLAPLCIWYLERGTYYDWFKELS